MRRRGSAFFAYYTARFLLSRFPLRTDSEGILPGRDVSSDPLLPLPSHVPPLSLCLLILLAFVVHDSALSLSDAETAIRQST